MHLSNTIIRRLTILLGVLLISACTTSPAQKQLIKHEDFGATDVFTRSFPGNDQTSCEAARRALLSQGYVISENKVAQIKGRRKYQLDTDVHAEIEFNVVCVNNSLGSNSTTVFVNAIRDRYSLKKSNTSASIGVSAIGSLSLPFGSNDDSMVKVASETIASGQFYEQFFGLLERYLDNVSPPVPSNNTSSEPNASEKQD